MPLTRKKQITFKRETSEGEFASPTGSEAVLVYEPTVQDDSDSTDRTPAGSSLSRDVVPIGRKTRRVSFQSDFRGSGVISPSVVEPDFGVMLECSAFEKVQPIRVPVTSPSGAGFHLGEVVQKSSSVRALVIGLFNGAGTLVHRLDVAGDVVVVPIEGTLTSSGTLTGESSGQTATIGTLADYAGVAYKPTSEKIIRVTTGAWAGGSAPTAGDVITVRTAGGVQVAIAQLVAITSGTTHDITLLEGKIANANVLHFGAATATINAVPVMTKTPSASIGANEDGRYKPSKGARGDFELSADAGNTLKFSWNFQGDPVTDSDALAFSTGSLSGIRAPRLFAADGAVCSYARTTAMGGSEQIVRLGTKSVSLSAGNSVTPDLDANSEGGSRGSNVSDRDPTASYTVNQAHSGFDWEGFRDNALLVHAATIVGKSKGNIVGWVIPNGQVMEANTGDAEGVATHEVQIKPRRILEQGDDELVIFQL